jgi:hypothetical protein
MGLTRCCCCVDLLKGVRILGIVQIVFICVSIAITIGLIVSGIAIGRISLYEFSGLTSGRDSLYGLFGVGPGINF